MEILFYDGNCGLCHGAVRFVVWADRPGTAFRFAPLGGEAFRSAVPEDRRAGLPDSIVILTASGELLTKSEAVAYMLRRLGGGWRAAAWLIEIFPLGLRDAVYDFIARIRHRLFRKPEGVCPLLPPHFRQRFDQ